MIIKIFYGNGNHELGNEFFVHKKSYQPSRGQSLSVMYIILIGCWCIIIILNVHAPTKDKNDDMKDSFYEKLECVFDLFLKYHMNILLGHFNAKVGRGDTVKPTIGSESLREISNDTGVRLVNFATSKILSRVQRSHITTITLVNSLQHLLRERH